VGERNRKAQPRARGGQDEHVKAGNFRHIHIQPKLQIRDLFRHGGTYNTCLLCSS